MWILAIVVQTYSHALGSDAIQTEALTSGASGVASLETVALDLQFAAGETSPAFARYVRFSGQVIGRPLATVHR
jgi:hypothetical protein